MSCTITAYFLEQQTICLCIAKSANEGTEAQREWLKNAEVLIGRLREHVEYCAKCKHNDEYS